MLGINVSMISVSSVKTTSSPSLSRSAQEFATLPPTLSTGDLGLESCRFGGCLFLWTRPVSSRGVVAQMFGTVVSMVAVSSDFIFVCKRHFSSRSVQLGEVRRCPVSSRRSLLHVQHCCFHDCCQIRGPRLHITLMFSATVKGLLMPTISGDSGLRSAFSFP